MQNLIVIKVGGNALTELTADFYQTLSAWRAQGKQILLVHGGGNEISRYAERSEERRVGKECRSRWSPYH